MIIHPINPHFDKNSHILILGSFPSVKSREVGFFYGHKQNRFWKVLSLVFGEDEPLTIDQKKEFLYRNRVALWDVIASCDIEGSADSSIKNVTPHDLGIVLNNSKVEKIFVNGKTAEKYYNKYIKEKLKITAICLPSTSPANAVKKIDELVAEWSIIKL